jgi:CheY-like chemotaxis protein
VTCPAGDAHEALAIVSTAEPVDLPLPDYLMPMAKPFRLDALRAAVASLIG